MSPRLLWITPEDGTLAPMLEALADAPREVVVMLRRPHASTRTLLAEGHALQATGHAVVVNRRVDVALALDARGVHLPERGLDVTDARALLGPSSWIGVSRHDRAGLEAAAAAGADYATLSPFAAVPGKGPALGATGFADVRRGVGIPVLALGGITKENGRLALASGADGFAVLRGGADLDALAGLLDDPGRDG
ncbi:MAG: thiamine phosphate synthase [Myxococcota bacterium]|nr:thiamine phosphate synthase [Myxococcota bacterium]